MRCFSIDRLGHRLGVGHSRPYEDLGAYILAVRYLLATESAALSPPNLQVEPFTVNDAKNSYELPWILRGVMDSPEVQRLFQDEIGVLKETILDWKPATKALRDIKQKVTLAILALTGSTVLTSHRSWNPWQAERRSGTEPLGCSSRRHRPHWRRAMEVVARRALKASKHLLEALLVST